MDGWRTAHDVQTRNTTLGVHVADLETINQLSGDRVDFTFYWSGADRWEGTDFVVYIDECDDSARLSSEGLGMRGDSTLLKLGRCASSLMNQREHTRPSSPRGLHSEIAAPREEEESRGVHYG